MSFTTDCLDFLFRNHTSEYLLGIVPLKSRFFKKSQDIGSLLVFKCYVNVSQQIPLAQKTCISLVGVFQLIHCSQSSRHGLFTSKYISGNRGPCKERGDNQYKGVAYEKFIVQKYTHVQEYTHRSNIPCMPQWIIFAQRTYRSDPVCLKL